MKNRIIITLFLITLSSCISIRNRDKLLSLNEIGDSSVLRKDGYYYTENYIKTNPYHRNEYGGYERDSTITFNQVRISTLSLTQNGSAMKLGSYSGMQYNLSYNFGIKCNLQDNNTLESAFEHFQCYVTELQKKNLIFLNSKAEIWDQGVYKIENNIITIQIFYNSIGNYSLYEEKGIIKNDSTFVLTNATDFQTGKKYEIKKEYKFKKMEDFPEIDNYILKNKKKFNKN
jgi:hypothetical protein